MQSLPERASYNRLARFRRNYASRQVRGRKEIANREAWKLRTQGKYQVGEGNGDNQQEGEPAP